MQFPITFHTFDRMRWLTVVIAAAALALAACSKSEPARTSSSSSAAPPPGAAPAPQPAPSIPHKIIDYMAGMKDIKDFSTPKPAPSAADAAKTPGGAASVPAATAPAPAAKPVETKAAAAPSATAAPVPVAAPPPPAKAPADNVVAKAAPTAAPASAPITTANPISREAPDFPREALKAGIDGGTVRARMSIDSGGNVTSVQIVESRPARIFDRAVRDTLGRWKFNAGTDNRSYETEVEFRR